ncbi:MAG TPA: SIS domain-containing protein [Planctomycetota bacterium]|nr:SIS domain-containing protein [Planctomycetota bacterium]
MSDARAAQPDLAALVAAAFAEHRRVFEASGAGLPALVEAAGRLLIDSYRAGGKAILFGNGGSMTDALHVEGELVGRFGYDRPGLPAVALCGSSSLTAIANDYSYQDVFARMLTAQARPGDVAVGFSTSGNSENVVRALQAARGLRLATISFTGEGGGRCAELSDVCIAVPSRHTPRVQELHILAAHTLCELVEVALFPRP